MGFVDVRWIGTKLNFADIFTKPVTPDVVKNLLRKMLGYDHSWYDSTKHAMLGCISANVEDAEYDPILHVMYGCSHLS